MWQPPCLRKWTLQCLCFPLQDVIDFLSSEHTEGMLKSYSELISSHLKTFYIHIDIALEIVR